MPSSTRFRKGFTLVEMSLVLSLTALIVGALAILYGYTLGRAGYSYAGYATTSQVSRLLDDIDATVSQGTSTTIVNNMFSNKALKVTLPNSTVDINGDGKPDAYLPSGVNRRGLSKFTPGKRVWYYMGDSLGTFGAPGTYVWKATRNDDLTPTTVDVDRSFAQYYSGTSQYSLVSAMTFAVDSTARTATTTVTASSLARADRKIGTGGSNEGKAITNSRTSFWGNWRR